MELIRMHAGVTTMTAVVYGAPFFIGVEAGLFEQFGLELIPTEYRGGPGTVRGIASGVEAIAVAGLTSTAAAIVAGEPLVIIAEVPTNNYYITLPEKGVDSVDDLAGIRVHYPSEGGGGHTHLLAALNAAGLDPATDVETILLPGLGAGWTGVREDIVDVAFAVDPFGATMIQNEGAVEAFRLNDVIHFPNLAIVTRRDVIRDRPEEVQAFIDAFRFIGEWINENIDEAAQIYANAIGIDVAVAKLALQNTPLGFAETDVAGLTLVEDTMKANDQVSPGARFRWQEWFDQSFLREDERINWDG